MVSERARLFALQMVFALNSLGLAVWFPRIPDVKEALGLDVLTLALALFGLPAGTMLGFLAVSRITARFGLKRSCIWSAALFLLVFITPGFATDAVSLWIALFFSGLSIAIIEVAMNAKASQTERVTGRRIMTRCHAFWSFGAVTGALIGGAFAQAGISFLTQQLILQPLFALASVAFALRLLPDEQETASSESSGFTLPSGTLLLLCAVPIGALMIEGAMMEWSALLLRTRLAADPVLTGAVFALFASAMAVTRLFGDRLADMFGPRQVIFASGLIMSVGILAFGLSQNLWFSAAAAVFAGLGCGNIYPLTMSMVGRIPSGRPERNVATLALTAFTAFLIGPPAIGLVADSFGLHIALAGLALPGLLPLLIARQQRPDQPQ